MSHILNAPVFRCGKLVLLVLIASGCPAKNPENSNPQPSAAPPTAPVESTPLASADKLIGNWQAVKVEQNGNQAPKSAAAGAGARFEAEKVQLIGSAFDEPFNYVIDESVTPRRIIMTHPAGAPRLQGIYELSGAALRLCYRMHAQADQGYPTEFATTPGSGLMLLELQRE